MNFEKHQEVPLMKFKMYPKATRKPIAKADSKYEIYEIPYPFVRCIILWPTGE